MLAVRFPPQMLSRLERYAKEHKISKSEAVRELVTRGLPEKT